MDKQLEVDLPLLASSEDAQNDQDFLSPDPHGATAPEQQGLLRAWLTNFRNHRNAWRNERVHSSFLLSVVASSDKVHPHATRLVKEAASMAKNRNEGLFPFAVKFRPASLDEVERMSRQVWYWNAVNYGGIALGEALGSTLVAYCVARVKGGSDGEVLFDDFTVKFFIFAGGALWALGLIAHCVIQMFHRRSPASLLTILSFCGCDNNPDAYQPITASTEREFLMSLSDIAKDLQRNIDKQIEFFQFFLTNLFVGAVGGYNIVLGLSLNYALALMWTVFLVHPAFLMVLYYMFLKEKTLLQQQLTFFTFRKRHLLLRCLEGMTSGERCKLKEKLHEL